MSGAVAGPPASRAGTWLAFDFGHKRVGVAVGDTVMRLARPLPTLMTPNGVEWPKVVKLVGEWRPVGLVVGLPVDEDGSEQAITGQARAFARALESQCHLPVFLADERFSSRAADDALREARASGAMARRVRKGDRDGQAARVILEQWLAELPSGI